MNPAQAIWRSGFFWVALLVAGFAVVMAVSANSSPSPAPLSLSYSSFLAKVAANDVRSVQINQSSGSITGSLSDKESFTAQGPQGGLPAADLTLLARHHVARNYAASSVDIWPTLITIGIPIGLIALLFVWMRRRGQSQMSGLDRWSRSQAKLHITKHPSTTFNDIAGYGAVRQEIREAVEFLKDPSRYEEVGAHVPKGILLVGPPGTGKTMFARAVAGEAGVPFITISGSQFMEMFVGVGAARVRDLFRTAREHQPSIVFVDEIDAIGRKRGTGLGGGHDEREQTLNQLLAEMDGFEATEGVILLAATNRPDILDPALLRPGRFDRQIVVPLPTLDERRAILEVHCRDKRMGSNVDLDELARGTPGMSGADLENLLNEAALIAVRRKSHHVMLEDLDAARDRVILGLERSSLALSRSEKRIVAYHEAGHTVLAHVLPQADPVHKVTILPTGLSLGATQQLPVDEHVIEQRPLLDDALAVRLGGRAAEQLIFGVPSTGAQDDLTSATELAARMVREWGMSAELGEMSWGQRRPVFLGEELVHSREYSDETARVIDREVSRILHEQAERARSVLEQHRRALEAVAGALQEKESLDGTDVAHLIEDAERHCAPTSNEPVSTRAPTPPRRRHARSSQRRNQEGTIGPVGRRAPATTMEARTQAGTREQEGAT